MKNVLITTKHRGVFFAQVSEKTLKDHKSIVSEDPLASHSITDLKNCRMAIYFGTTKGIIELADEGPTSKSRIGSPADVEVLHDVTAIFNVTEKASAKWLSK